MADRGLLQHRAGALPEVPNTMPNDVAAAIIEEASRSCQHAEVFEEWGETRSVSFEHNNLNLLKIQQK